MNKSTILGSIIVVVILLPIITIFIFPRVGTSLVNALKTGVFGSIWKPHTVMILNHSTAMIERYKNERGAYPIELENVKDILAEDEVFIYGDLMGPKVFGEKLRPLYYERLNEGETFYLFGIGLDGQPFSEDDVYPDPEVIKESVGFRKPNIGA